MNDQAAAGTTERVYPVPHATVGALLVAGGVLGAVGDALLYDAGAPGLNLSLCIALVAMAAIVLQRRTAVALDRGRVGWLLVGLLFGAGFAWRDAPPLRLLAFASAILTFAIAAHRPTTEWVRRAGVLRYVVAVVLGAIHTWTAAVLAFINATRMARVVGTERRTGRRRTAALARGLLLAVPLLVMFGGLLMSADEVFAQLVTSVFRFDFERVASHVLIGRFDVAYATSLSADAVPVLIEALPTLPLTVQCPIARSLLRRWPPDDEPFVRNWNWSAMRASEAVREHAVRLRSMVAPNQACPAPAVPDGA